MIKMFNGKFSEQREEVMRGHMLPKNGDFSKHWRTNVLICILLVIMSR